MIQLLPRIIITPISVNQRNKHLITSGHPKLLTKINAFYQLPFLTFMLKVFYVKLISLLKFIEKFNFFWLDEFEVGFFVGNCG